MSNVVDQTFPSVRSRRCCSAYILCILIASLPVSNAKSRVRGSNGRSRGRELQPPPPLEVNLFEHYRQVDKGYPGQVIYDAAATQQLENNDWKTCN